MALGIRRYQRMKSRSSDARFGPAASPKRAHKSASTLNEVCGRYDSGSDGMIQA